MHQPAAEQATREDPAFGLTDALPGETPQTALSADELRNILVSDDPFCKLVPVLDELDARTRQIREAIASGPARIDAAAHLVYLYGQALCTAGKLAEQYGASVSRWRPYAGTAVSMQALALWTAGYPNIATGHRLSTFAVDLACCLNELHGLGRVAGHLSTTRGNCQ